LGAVVALVECFWQRMSLHVASRHRAGRLKQWLNYLRRHYPEAQQAFDTLRLVHDPQVMAAWLCQPMQALRPAQASSVIIPALDSPIEHLPQTEAISVA